MRRRTHTINFSRKSIRTVKLYGKLLEIKDGYKTISGVVALNHVSLMLRRARYMHW